MNEKNSILCAECWAFISNVHTKEHAEWHKWLNRELSKGGSAYNRVTPYGY